MENGRRPHFVGKMEDDLNFWRIEDLNFWEMGNDLKKIQIEDDLKMLKQYNFENRRRSLCLKLKKRTYENNATKNN